MSSASNLGQASQRNGCGGGSSQRAYRAEHVAELCRFTPSLSYVGQGVIMGFPVTISMNLGMLVGWAVLSPLSKHLGWAPGPVSSSTTGARGWIVSPAFSTHIRSPLTCPALGCSRHHDCRVCHLSTAHHHILHHHAAASPSAAIPFQGLPTRIPPRGQHGRRRLL